MKCESNQNMIAVPTSAVCRLVNLLAELEMQKALGPLASLGCHFSMEDQTIHINMHSHYPPRIPPWGSVIQPSRGGKEGKVSGCSSL